MKKLFTILLLGIFMISFASAWSFDNVKDSTTITFDGKSIIENELLQKYNPIEITNAFGLGATIFEGYLSQHTETCSDDCSSTIEIKLHEERPLVDKVIFKTLKSDGKWINQNIRNYQFYLKTGETQYSVDDYKEQCTIIGFFVNGTEKQSCSNVKVGSHLEFEPTWTPYVIGEKVPVGIYTLKLEAEKKPDRVIDWVIETSGETLNEWAIWGSSGLLNNLVGYYELNAASGVVIDSTGNFNGTNIGATRNINGKLDKAFRFDGSARPFVDDFPNMTDTMTACVWMNFTNANTNSYIMGRWADGVSSNQEEWLLGFTAADKIQFIFDASGAKIAVSTGAYNDAAWHFVCGRANSTHVLLNIDNDTEVIVGQSYTGNSDNSNLSFMFGGGGVNYTGELDEIYISNRSLSDTEISELWNSSNAFSYPFGTGSTVTLNSPGSGSTTGIQEINFSCSANVIGSSTLVNMSLLTNETGNWEIRNTTTGLSTTSKTESWNRTFTEQQILWGCKACDSDGDCGFSTENRTVTVDITSPLITIQSPKGVINFGTVGENETLNITFTDPALDSCWYDYNGTNITIDGCQSGVKNSTNFILDFNNLDMIIYTNDTVGNLNSTIITWSYFILQNSQTFNANTTEGSTETFSINFTANETPTSASLIYNGTITSADIDATNFPIVVIVSETKTIPNVDAITNFTFLWNIITASSNLNTTENNQTVNNLNLDNCSVFTNVLFNYTIVDEATQLILNGTEDNVSLEVDITIYNADKSILILNYSAKFTETNPNSICSATDLFNGTNFILDSTLKYSSDPRVIEYYNIRDSVISNASTTQEITLFDILTSESTDFQITFKNSDFVVVEGALIQVNRQYVSEGVFKTVELPITDSNGQTIVHLVRNDIVYNYIVTKGGVVIGTFNNLIAFCEDPTLGQCFIPLNALQGTVSTFNPDEDIGISSAFTFNETTRDLVLTFSTNDGTVKTILFNATKMDQIGNTTVCSSSVTSSSGTLTCNIPASIGNETIIGFVYVDGVLKLTKYFSVAQDLDLGDGGYFLLLFLVISLGLIFSESKSLIIVGVILGFIAGGLLFLIKGGIIGSVGAIMWLIVTGVILIWKLNSEGQT